MEGRPGFVIAPWCGSAACEAPIKAETQATIRNMPFDDDAGGDLHPLRPPGDHARAVCEGVRSGLYRLNR